MEFLTFIVVWPEALGTFTLIRCAGGIAECGGQVSFAEANQTQENNVGFLLDKTKPEEVLDLEPIDFFGPVPTEAFQGLDDRKTGGFDPPSNRALFTCRYFALKEPTQVVEMAPVVGGAFDSQGFIWR